MSVAFVREESAESAQDVTLPERLISTHPNLVTRSGFRALEQAVADSREVLKAAQVIEDANERHRALELAPTRAPHEIVPWPTGDVHLAAVHAVVVERALQTLGAQQRAVVVGIVRAVTDTTAGVTDRPRRQFVNGVRDIGV